jgi:predicted proteasome-type protease
MESQIKKKVKPLRKRNTNEEDKYVYPVMVRYNKKQYELMSKKSEKTGIKLAILVRDASINSNINITSKFDLLTYNQIIKIGVNINQIAKKFNIIFAKEELNSENEKLKIFINELRNILSAK